VVSGADDSLFGGLRISDSIGKGLSVIIIIIVSCRRWNIWKLSFFAFIPHLMVVFCDFPLFWHPLVLLGSRIRFCKASDFCLALSLDTFFGQLLRSAWCVWAFDKETLVPKVYRLCETTSATLQWNCANAKVSHIVSYGVSWGEPYPSWLQEVSLPLRKRICLAAKFQLDKTRWRPYMSRPLVLQEIAAPRISRLTRHVN